MSRADRRRNIHEEVKRLKSANGDLRSMLLGEAQNGKAREDAFKKALAIIGALQKERELLRIVEVAFDDHDWGEIEVPDAITGALQAVWDFRKSMRKDYGVQL